MKPLLLLTTLVLFWGLCRAQVKTNFNNKETITATGKFKKNFTLKSPYVIPAMDIDALLQKENLDRSLSARPFRLAEPISVNIDVVTEAIWTEDDQYAYGKFSVLAAGAKSISLNFDQFNLPNGTELYVYNKNGEMITGPVTETENNVNNFWGSWVYRGNLVTIDFKTPILKF